jgi:UDPglucose--hexose-1-phosphate uridylyltransferase
VPELRKDPVVGRWVIISTERSRRPSDFTIEPVRARGGPCVFCAGNEDKTPPEIIAGRPHESPHNGPGWSFRVVPNKFPALRIEGELEPAGEGLYDRMNGVGAHEVVIETPDHHASMAGMSIDAVTDVFMAFRERLIDLKKDPRFEYVLVFKNHGGRPALRSSTRTRSSSRRRSFPSW